MRGGDRRAPQNLGDPPRGLRSASLVIGSSEYVVLSFPAGARPQVPGLSRAESDVLWAAVDGLSNVEIAAARRRSVFTIQNQLSTACRKLGVSSRTEAALKLARLELGA